MSEVARLTKKMDLTEAVASQIPDYVESLAAGGMHMHNNPMALVREIIRQKKRIKRLITSPAASIQADMLIGAGLVEEVVTSYFGMEHLGLAPAFRRFSQEGRLKVFELDELTLILGLRAAANGQPFAALPVGVQLSDVTRAAPEFYVPTTDPFTGKTVMVTPPIKPQVALIVTQQADEFGNGVFKGSVFTDREMMFAADTVILQAEDVVPNRQITKTPLQVTVPGFMVKAVVHTRVGCHPTSCHRVYHYDEEHLKEYIRLAATAEGFEEYLEKFVLDRDETNYLNQTQLAKRGGITG